ncbi:MAG TPA: TRAP transporter small permease subunit [Kiloniellales bacterium]|nr:TRAP transporter small permease subunit [Kiloniellales bacterium]
MRRLLDGLYRLSLGAAALSLVLILAIVLTQVAFSLLDRVLQWSGAQPLGLLIPSYAEISGYLLAAASFLALGGAFRDAAHIRVTLILSRLDRASRRPVEIAVLALALAVTLYLAFFLGRLTWQSFTYGDLSPGLLPIPLWLPQSVMCLGVGVLAVALLDDLLRTLGGGSPVHLEAEQRALVAGPDAGAPLER